jgi:hypothetical protein
VDPSNLGLELLITQLATTGFLGLTGALRGKTKRTTIADPTAARPADLVNRRFGPPAADLWRAALRGRGFDHLPALRNPMRVVTG